MNTQQHLKKQNDVIRQEATKVIEDVVKLTKHLRAAGLEKAEVVGNEIQHTLLDQVDHLDQQRQLLWKKTEKIGRAAHKSVKSQPYFYIGGAFGIGFILGKILSRDTPLDQPM